MRLRVTAIGTPDGGYRGAAWSEGQVLVVGIAIHYNLTSALDDATILVRMILDPSV